jgi:type VI secretion system secreted protein Hcp
MSVVGIIIVIVLYFSFFYERKNKCIPAHIWLTDENNSPLIGECLMSTRLGSTELKSFNHSVWIPTDHNTGKLTGTRLHVPITLKRNRPSYPVFIQRCMHW